MKNDEFNEFLRQKANEFEMKPSSGSFDGVVRKMDAARAGGRGLKIWLPMAAVLITGLVVVLVYNFSTGAENPAVQTAAQSETVTTPSEGSVITAPQTADESATQTTATISSPETSVLPTNPQHGPSNPKQVVTPVEAPSKYNNMDELFEGQENTALPGNKGREGVDEPETPVIVENNDANAPQQPEPVNENTPVITKVDEPKGSIDITEPNTPDTSIAVANKTDKGEGEKGNKVKRDKKYLCRSNISLSPYFNLFSTSVYYSKQNSTIGNQSQRNNFGISGQGTGGGNYSSVIDEAKFMGGTEAGIKINFGIKGPWGITAGVGINRWKTIQRVTAYSTTEDSVETFVGFDSSGNRPVYEWIKHSTNETVQVKEFITANSSFQIPLLANYTVNKRRWAFDFQAGFIGTYLYKSVIQENDIESLMNIITAYNYSENMTEYRKLNVQGVLGAYITYKPHSCFGIYAGPRMATSLFSVNITDAPGDVKRYPMFWGLETGIKINL